VEPRTYRVEGVVLKAVPVEEADRLVTLFTRFHGKRVFRARGARRPASRLAGLTEPLTYARFLAVRGRSLDLLTQGEGLEAFRPLREDLDRLSRALYLLALVDLATPLDHPQPGLLDLLLTTLHALQEVEGEPALDRTLRWFEVRLADALGYCPQVGVCALCGADLAPGRHAFAPSAGGAVCPGCRPRVPGAVLPLSVNALKVLRFLVGAGERAVRRLRLRGPVAEEVQGLLRAYLEAVLEAPLPPLPYREGVPVGQGRAHPPE